MRKPRRTAEPTVLYDAPGPRTRRLSWISSAIAVVAIAAAAYFFVYRPLDAKGQFSMELWGPLIDPGNENFAQVWNRLGYGFRNTLLAAVLAIVASLVLGTLLALLRVELASLTRRRFTGVAAPVAYLLRAVTWVLAAVTRFCVEVFRGLPVIITIFFVSSALPVLGVDNALWYVVGGLTIYNMVVLAEILRSGITGLPRGQAEAASALGLRPFQTTRMILLPQAFRVMLPALISQLVVILKDTSLGFITSYEELMNIAKQIIGVLSNPIQVYFVIGVIFIVVNYSLSRLAQYTQRRLARARATSARVATPEPAAQLEAEVAAGHVPA